MMCVYSRRAMYAVGPSPAASYRYRYPHFVPVREITRKNPNDVRSMRYGSPFFRRKLAKIIIGKFGAAIYLKYSIFRRFLDVLID